MGAVHLLNCLFWHKVTTQAQILFFTLVSQLNFFLFLVFSQLEGKEVSVCPYLISLTLGVFYLKSTYWALCRKACCDVSSSSVSAAAYLGPVVSRRVIEIPADEFPWLGFHIMHKHMLKIRSVGHVKAPPLPFPLLKVPLAHRVIFSFC